MIHTVARPNLRILLLSAALLAACSSSTAPKAKLYRYQLATVDGMQLPRAAPFIAQPTGADTLYGATIAFVWPFDTANSTYSYAAAYQRGATPDVQFTEGMQLRGDSVGFISLGAAGKVNGQSLDLVAGSDVYHFTLLSAQ